FLRRMNVANGAVSLAGGVPLSPAPGTSPAIAADSAGGFTIAFHANGAGTLWWIDRNNTWPDSGIKMAPGSSPSITEQNGSANYWIAYVRDTNVPAVFDTASQTSRDFLGEAVADHTNVAIRETGPGVFWFAFVGRDDHALWRDNS